MGPVLVHAFLPPATSDHVDILAVAGPAFSLYAVEYVLPILQVAHRGLKFFELLFNIHQRCPYFAA